MPVENAYSRGAKYMIRMVGAHLVAEAPVYRLVGVCMGAWVSYIKWISYELGEL